MAFFPFVFLSSCPDVMHTSLWTIYQTAFPSTIQHSYLKSSQSQFLLSLYSICPFFLLLLLLFAFLSLNNYIIPSPPCSLVPCVLFLLCHFYFFLLSSFSFFSPFLLLHLCPSPLSLSFPLFSSGDAQFPSEIPVRCGEV